MLIMALAQTLHACVVQRTTQKQWGFMFFLQTEIRIGGSARRTIAIVIARGTCAMMAARTTTMSTSRSAAFSPLSALINNRG